MDEGTGKFYQVTVFLAGILMTGCGMAAVYQAMAGNRIWATAWVTGALLSLILILSLITEAIVAVSRNKSNS
ncbi:MAG: hypothetical protein QG675_608 [Patescibacteria group bacterium]|jgi:hypothetical protein|nr:hypothetical protein [Patescibacteria group bacterium]